MKNIKLPAILLLSLLINLPAVSQELFTKDFRHRDSTNFDVRINPDFFLLGTFSDYMGRFFYIDRSTQIDMYYPSEESLAVYIAGFIEDNYDIKVDLVFDEDSKRSEIFSQPIAERLHAYYDDDGYLKDEFFDSEEKIYSFITGVLFRNGKNWFDDIFYISVSNSPKKDQIYKYLKILECNNIIYKNFRGYIPTVTHFYFEATPRMVKYFNLVRAENHNLHQNESRELYGDMDELIEEITQEEKEFQKCIKMIFRM